MPPTLFYLSILANGLLNFRPRERCPVLAEFALSGRPSANRTDVIIVMIMISIIVVIVIIVVARGGVWDVGVDSGMLEWLFFPACDEIDSAKWQH